MPRRAWLVLLVAVVFATVLVVRHNRAGDDKPPPAPDRTRLFRSAEAALRADPSIADLVYSSPHDQWDVTPAGDADPRAFGRYVCFLLGNAGVARAHTSVRVIDGARLEASGFDYAAASRGTIACEGNAP